VCVLPWKFTRPMEIGQDTIDTPNTASFRSRAGKESTNFSLFHLSPDLQSFVSLVVERCHSQPPWKFPHDGNQVKRDNVTLVLRILKAHYANEHQRRQHVGEIQSFNFTGLAHETRESNMDGCMMSRVFSMGGRPIKAKTDPDPAGHTAHLTPSVPIY